MKTYIISLVLMRIMPVLAANGQPEMSIQNVVNVIEGDDSDDGKKEAFMKCTKLAKEKHKNHNVVVFVITDMDEALDGRL